MNGIAKKSTGKTRNLTKKIDKSEVEKEKANENKEEIEDEDNDQEDDDETSIATRIKSLRRSSNRTRRLNYSAYNNKSENNEDVAVDNTNVKDEQPQKHNKKRTKTQHNTKKMRNQKQKSPNTSDASISDDRKEPKLSDKCNHRLDNSMSTGDNKIYLENKKFAESILLEEDQDHEELKDSHTSINQQNTTNENDNDNEVEDDKNDECNNMSNYNESCKVKNLRKSLEEQMINEEQQATSKKVVVVENRDSNEKNKDSEGCFINPQLAAFNFGSLFYCNFCGYSANNTNKILHHLFVHVFKCNLCSHFTYTKYDLMKHIYKFHRPNKELRIKRLVLEVTSNDWYFLCSENDAHCISNALTSDNDDTNTIKVSSGTPRKSSSDPQSKRASNAVVSPAQQSKTAKKNDNKSKLTSILKTCIETNYPDTSSTSNENSFNVQQDSGQKKKPVMNYFLTKVEKKQEKITPVIQSNKISSSSTTNEPTDTNKPSSNDAVDSNTNKTTTTTTAVTSQSQQKSSKLTQILSSDNDLLNLNSNEPKLSKVKKTQANLNETDAVGTPPRSTRSKRVPPPKKYTTECTEFSSETKKDLESIKNKYTNMDCRYTCKQCKYEANSAVIAYTHLVISNSAHNLKCFVCDVYNSDNVCSYKMHLLSKHKAYASADKLFHEYFTIVDNSTNHKLSIDSPLSTILSSTAATTVTATNANHSSSTPISIKSSQTSGVKRILAEPDEPTNQTNPITSNKRKKLFENNNEKEASKPKHTPTLDSISYDTEVLDDGSTIYICSKCKLVFLKKEPLMEHKCYSNASTSSINSSKKSANNHDKTQKSNNSAANNTSNNSKYNNINEFYSITRSALNKNDTNKHIISSNDDCDDEERIENADYDNIKNNSDVIYIDE